MQAAIYALTLFVSAFLMFLVQPMVGRFVLPWLGGGSGVWSVCMLFFQGALLLGYLYAHLSVRLLGPRGQATLHAALLTVSLPFLPVAPDSSHGGTQAGAPALGLLWLLLRDAGLPCILISASAPLLQHWFAQWHRASPYRLYAVSNLGSLLGLISYPLLIEPMFGLQTQARVWSAGYWLLAALSFACAGIAFRTRPTGSVAPEYTGASPLPSLSALGLWLTFPCLGVTLLLSITTELTTNLAPMPLLWVVPLALYLLTFIGCFASDAPYQRRRWLSLYCALILPTLWMSAIEALVGVWPLVALSCLCLFSGCMVCHGELARLKPHARYLSLYYLWLAAGGVLGGVFVSFVAPLVFDRFWELPIALFGVFTLGGLGARPSRSAPPQTDPNPLGFSRQPRAGLGPGVFLIWAVCVAGFAFVGTLPLRAASGTIATARSFYGRLSVVHTQQSGTPVRRLVHGRILHGAQYSAPERKREPTLYFSRSSGVGLALTHSAYAGRRHIGVLGLGIGTLAAYGRPGDLMRFYELDPLVHDFAERHFSFLADSVAQLKVVLGDGRLSLERELRETGSHRFDVLVIDAFNADAVPTHLLTREAFALYWKHLRPQGTLALNATNTFLDLAPLVTAHAQVLGKQALLLRTQPNEGSLSGATWILLTSNPQVLGDPLLRAHASPLPEAAEQVWSDDYSYVLQALK